jgi:hypothetical protein
MRKPLLLLAVVVLGSFTHIGAGDRLCQGRAITEACGAFTKSAYRYALDTSIKTGLGSRLGLPCCRNPLGLLPSLGKAQAMSWLVANWYGVFALFGAPLVVGIGFWAIAHRVIGKRERHDREREARKLDAFQLSRTARRR